MLRAAIGAGSVPDLPAAGTDVWAVVCGGVASESLGPMVRVGDQPEVGDLVSLYRADERGTALAIVFGGPGTVNDGIVGAPVTPTPSTGAPVVGFTFDNALVVVDPATGAFVRRLATVPVSIVSGPLGVVLTPDGTRAIAMWGTGESCSSERVGVVPIDGSAPLEDWGALNGHAAVSPDGRRAAWLDPGADCRKVDLVIHDIAAGTERRIAQWRTPADGDTSFAGGRGPWWTADSRSVVLQQSDTTAPVMPAYQRKGLVFDVDTATSVDDARSVALPCLGTGPRDSAAVQDVAGGSVVFARYDEQATSAVIWRCPLDGGAGEELLTISDVPTVVGSSRDGRTLLLTARDGSVSASFDGAAPSPLPIGRFRFLVAW